MLKLQIPVNAKGDVFEFKLAKEKVTIGRRHDNDIRIKETYVSAYHAELSRGNNGEIYLRDRDSSNGTFINGKRVRDRVKVRKGDILKFGSLKCSIEEVIEKLNERPLASVPGSDRSALSRGAISNSATAVSTNPSLSSGNRPISVDEDDETSPLAMETTTALHLASSPNGNGGGSNGATYTSPPVSKNGGNGSGTSKALTHELEALKSQFNLNKRDLRKAKEDLKAVSAELIKAKEKAEKEDRLKIEKIEKLEAQLKAKSTRNDDLDHRLRLASGRADQLESELENHKSDMSVEIKAAMKRMTHTKHDNVLLQDTLDALESERNKYRDESVALTKKLSKTREGFSFLLRNSGGKLEESDQLTADLKKQNEEALTTMANLEDELDALRDDFSQMDLDYREKLKEAEALQTRTSNAEAILIEDLDIANKKIKTQKADIVKLESQIESIVAEREASEEDWKARVIELKTTNELLAGGSQDLETLEAQIKRSSEEIKKLRSEKTSLESATKELRAEKKALAAATELISEEKEDSVKTINQVKEEGHKASQKLDSILHNLHESEKKVTYLRSLESELEKSVLRAQRSALSRKGIYSDDEEGLTAIWPETEQLICRELIDRLELLEDMLKRYQQSWFFPKVADQLNLLKDSFLVLLKNHSVDQFDLEPGTELSVDSRKKIQLISVDDLDDPKLKRLSQQGDGQRTRVLQTIRPGYIYSKGGQDVIIRKAEVVVA